MGSSHQEGQHACILLGVWGEKYIKDFLRLSLPSLLAPDNIPALARTYPTKFIFLTRSYDIAVFKQDAAFLKLASFCEIEFVPINDLLGISNYATILTLAYDRAIKREGEQMLQTYFIFLTSDYIMANGSLAGLIRCLKKGYSGVCAGNFQVIQEHMEPFLLGKIDANTPVLKIEPREMLKKSFEHLHPITMTSYYDQPLVHNYRANRFFYRLNNHTMAGRFYLLHMLCIKPEITDYQIGSFCDYSFIPAMCPSGNIATLDDSDDYLVVELQPKEHELENISPGVLQTNKLVKALAEWTTQQHRDNAKHTIYFHTEDLNQADKIAIENKLGNFITTLSTALNQHEAQPHFNHPYWFGAVTTQKQHRHHNDYHYADLTSLTTSGFKKWFHRAFGKPPVVFRWHHRFREYKTIRQRLLQYANESKQSNMIVLYDSYQTVFMHYHTWLKNTLHIDHHFYVQNLIHSRDKIDELQKSRIERCILFSTLNDFKNIKTTLALLEQILTKNGNVLILIPNDKNHYPSIAYDFQKEFSYRLNLIANTSYRVTDITTIHDNLSLLGSMSINTITKQFNYNKKLKFFFYALAGIPGSIISFIRHCLPQFTSAKKGHCTGILVTLTLTTEPGST